MSFDLTEETLEEGRVALYQLEKQLRERQPTVGPIDYTEGLNDAASLGSNRASKAQSSTHERRILDQLPREARLNNRLESLGLTVEELDDRGLLSGGASVPSYYTSMRQKSRRSMELQSRTHRLQERGKETLSKLFNAFMHMIRILVHRGMQLEEYCRHRDPDRRGLLHKKLFLSILKSLGLPFNLRELQEIVNHYSVPSSEQVDYVTFLRDARILKKSNPTPYETTRGMHYGEVDLATYTTVLTDVKRMLLDSIRSLKKHPDDVYRMFARWDTLGTNTVTATQFLRVLARLHIDLNDQDQDFLVELLDTNGMGRIDFDGLLSFCFTGYEAAESMISPAGMHSTGASLTSADDNGHESLSAMSLEGNNSVEQRNDETPSTYNRQSNFRRPKTAALSRPYHGNGGVVNGHASTELYVRPSSSSGAAPYHVAPVSQQPEYEGNQSQYVDEQYVKERPDDVIHGEEKYLLSNGRDGVLPTGYEMNTAPAATAKIENSEYERIDTNDVTDFLEREESPPNLRNNNSNNWVAGGSRIMSNISNEDLSSTPSSPTGWSGPNGWRNATRDPFSVANATNNSTQLAVTTQQVTSQSEPIDHLVLLANQILTTLRDIIMTHYRRGRSLREIFQHFDRDGKQYFSADDFIVGIADMRIETSKRVADIAINIIAIDGFDKVTFGEFKVFVLDSDHKLLEFNVQEQLAQLLEQKGREFQSIMVDTFWQEEDAVNDYSQKSGESRDRRNEEVSSRSFVSALQKIGLILTSSELTRLVDRFDCNETAICSVPRFLRMVHNSKAWKAAEKVLAYSDEAVEEAEYLRKQIKSGVKTNKRGEPFPQLPDELISMCEYLGIRVLSEPNMIWIAADALKAPLPVSWSAKKDSEGRTYFYNHLSNQSRSDHPLDPHFRKLRDKYRQSSQDPIAETPIRSKLNATRRLSASTGMIGPAADTLNMLSGADALPGVSQNDTNRPDVRSFTLSPLNQNMNAGSDRPNIERYASTSKYSGLVESSQALVASRASEDDVHGALGMRGIDLRIDQQEFKVPSIDYFHDSNAKNKLPVYGPNSSAMDSQKGASQSNNSPRTADKHQQHQHASNTRPGSAPYQKRNVTNSRNPVTKKGNFDASAPPPSVVNYNLRNVGILHDTTAKFRGSGDKVVNNQATIEAIYKSPYSKQIYLPASMTGASGASGKQRSTSGLHGNSLGAGTGFASSGMIGSSQPSNSRSGGNGTTSSAVDRALGMSRGNYSVSGGGSAVLSKPVATDVVKQSKLSAMYEENIIEKLDNAIVGRNSGI